MQRPGLPDSGLCLAFPAHALVHSGPSSPPVIRKYTFLAATTQGGWFRGTARKINGLRTLMRPPGRVWIATTRRFHGAATFDVEGVSSFLWLGLQGC